MGKTKIEWATHTASWLAGCTKVSPACTNCYAERMSARLAKMPKAPPRYHGDVVVGQRWTGTIRYDRAALVSAFRTLRRPGVRLFANSMSDTFHRDAPAMSLTDLAYAIDEAIRTQSKGVLMLLTKRPENMLAWQREHFPGGLPSWVWVGCTVENQARADERLPFLLDVDAGVRFVSCEPLLGPIDLHGARYAVAGRVGLCGAMSPWRPDGGLHWVIAGGETGPSVRPTHPGWVRQLRDDCVVHRVPFFFKAWGDFIPDDHAHILDDDLQLKILSGTLQDVGAYSKGIEGLRVGCYRVGKHLAGRLLDGRSWDELPGGAR